MVVRVQVREPDLSSTKSGFQVIGMKGARVSFPGDDTPARDAMAFAIREKPAQDGVVRPSKEIYSERSFARFETESESDKKAAFEDTDLENVSCDALLGLAPD